MNASRCVRSLFLLCCLVTGGTHAHASTINGFSLPNYALPGYVIAADGVDGSGATNRHKIDTQCSVTIDTAGSYRVDWELLAPNDSIVASSDTVLGAISTVPDTRTVSGFLEPTLANRLQVGVGYRLRVRLFNSTAGTTADTGTQANGRTFIHMAGTDPASTALNVVTEITSITINRQYLIEANPARRTIPAVVNYTLYRYDNWDTATDDPRPIVVNFNTSLLKDNDNAVQSVSVTGTPAVVNNVSSFAVVSGDMVPKEVNGSRAIEIDPASIFLPTSYRLESQISHVEQAIPLVTVTANTAVSTATFISHFTGQLNFGPVVTHFTNLAGTPFVPVFVPVPGVTSVHMRITPGSGSGTVDGTSDHHFGDGSKTINVVLDENGIATVEGDRTSGPQTYVTETLLLESDPGGDNTGSVNGVDFKRMDPIEMDETGLLATITAYLPVGVGWREDQYNGFLLDGVDFPGVYLNQQLKPISNPVTNPGADAFYLCEETKPVMIECNSLEWDLASGEFKAGAFSQAHSIRQPLLDFLLSYQGSYQEPGMSTKVSNDHLYNHVTAAAAARVKKGDSGGGELTTVLSSAANAFVPHFPAGSAVSWSGTVSFISIEADLVKPGLSVLNNASFIPLVYAQHCQEEYERGCGDQLGAVVTLTSATGNLKLTGDGGVHAMGSITMDPLSWGAIPKPVPAAQQKYAHKVTTPFADGNFLMAGTFLRGDQNPLNDPDGPGVLLLSGFDPNDLTVAERPESTNYVIGEADYPGINFRTTGNHDGESTLQGDAFGPYDLTARSKYYIRPSGVTGIHEAPPAGFPSTAAIGDYLFGLSKYAFAFKANEMVDSRASGYLDLPDPTDFTLNFTRLQLSCLGALESFDISGAGNVDSKEFDFWKALFTPFSARFDSKSDCNPGDGTTLVLGFSAHASHFATAFAGNLGILPTGDFVTQAMVDAEDVAVTVPARLTLPGSLKLVGTQDEVYEFFPAQGAYLNDATGADDGFWSLFGTFDVPFFRNMEVHLHTRAGSLTQGSIDPEKTSPIYVMGGWPDHGWEQGGYDPFGIASFDPEHKGYASNLAAYRKTTDNGNEQYLPRAMQSWLGIIPFDYPLKWSHAAFNFTGKEPKSSNLLVIKTQSELVYLDAEHTELTFGVRYEGLPSINLSNFVINAVDDATGMSSAFIEAATDKVFYTLQKGVDELASTLSDKADDLVGKAVDALTADILDDLIEDLTDKIDDGVYTELELKAIISAHLGTSSDLTIVLNKLDDGMLNPAGLFSDLSKRLVKVENAIDSLIDEVHYDPESGVELPTEEVATGLLKQVYVEGEFHRLVFEALSKEMVGVLSTIVDASTIEEELAELIQEQSPTLDSVTEILSNLKTAVAEVRRQIEQVDDLGLEIRDLINAPGGGQVDFGNVTAEVELKAFDIVLGATTEDLANLEDISLEWRQKIAREIKDSLYAKPVIADIQEAVKERLYDVQASFNQAVDSAFATLNRAIQDALSEAIAELDVDLGPVEGAFRTAQTVKAGELNGYARINQDSLECLRLDAMVELSLPDPMKVGAYFEIKELDSDGPAACSGAFGEKTTEITLGCTNVGLAWANLALEGVRADMNVKFGLSNNLPVSIGGEFEMTQGTIDFETFEIYKLGASVMFGSTENYIAAAVGVRFGPYDMAGGIFLGRSCDLDPLKLIDPLVADVVPTSSLTGIYSYGEATFPIYGTGTCFFNISAKAGAGVLYFAEGPTYGGRMTMGVYGEALCAVEVGGEISLAGTKSGDTYNFAGYGRVFGQAGKCPLCLKANFQVDFRYTDLGGWEVQF